MKFFLLILIGLLGHIENAYSQTDTTKNNVFGGFIIMPIEFPVIDTKEINQQLTANGFPPANYSTANIGIGFQLYTNRVITTFSFNKTTKKDDNDTVGWKHVLNGLSLPLYLSYLNDEYHVEYFDSLKMMYIQINASNGSEGFNQAIKNSLDSNDVQHLIIDLRFNDGGDYTKLAGFSKAIPQKIKGKIYVITGKATFSAGICIAVRLKYFSKDRAVIIEQNSGDRLQFWAEGKYFSLPNSKITARAVNGYHDWKNDNFELFKTHWINLFYGVAVKDLTPNIPIKVTFHDYCKGIDKTMNEITTLHNTQYSKWRMK